MRNADLITTRFSQLLYGRGDELDWLEKEFNAHDQSARYIPIVVIGEAGIGKTALVADFFEHQSRVPPLWVDCREWESNTPDYQHAINGRHLEARDRRGAPVVLDHADAVPQSRVVELFLRAVDHKSVRRVVVTSREELNFPKGQRVLRLAPLTDSEAQLWLRQMVRIPDLKEETTAELLRLAKGHPLSLVAMTNLARSLSGERLGQVLNGHLYDIRDVSSREQQELIAVARPVIITANQAIIERLKKQPQDVFKLSSRQYEEMIAELLHDMGYRVELTPATRDGGKDILASIRTDLGDVLCLVEAKKYREDRKVSVELVRTLYGTLHDYQASSAMLVTTSTFSKDARALQQRHRFQLSLRDYTDVAEWIQKYGRKAANP